LIVHGIDAYLIHNMNLDKCASSNLMDIMIIAITEMHSYINNKALFQYKLALIDELKIPITVGLCSYMQALIQGEQI